MSFFKRIMDGSLRVIFFLLIINLLLDIYGLYTLTNKAANFVSFNIYTLIETAFLYIFFYRIFIRDLAKKTVLFVFSIFFIFWLSLFIKYGSSIFLLNCAALEYTTILAFAINYYYEQLVKANSSYVYLKPRFWIVSAYLVYVAGTFFLLLYIPLLPYEQQLKYYVLNYVFVIIRTILLSIAMFMKNNQPLKQEFKLHKAASK